MYPEGQVYFPEGIFRFARNHNRFVTLWCVDGIGDGQQPLVKSSSKFTSVMLLLWSMNVLVSSNCAWLVHHTQLHVVTNRGIVFLSLSDSQTVPVPKILFWKYYFYYFLFYNILSNYFIFYFRIAFKNYFGHHWSVPEILRCLFRIWMGSHSYLAADCNISRLSTAVRIARHEKEWSVEEDIITHESHTGLQCLMGGLRKEDAQPEIPVIWTVWGLIMTW